MRTKNEVKVKEGKCVDKGPVASKESTGPG